VNWDKACYNAISKNIRKGRRGKYLMTKETIFIVDGEKEIIRVISLLPLYEVDFEAVL